MPKQSSGQSTYHPSSGGSGKYFTCDKYQFQTFSPTVFEDIDYILFTLVLVNLTSILPFSDLYHLCFQPVLNNRASFCTWFIFFCFIWWQYFFLFLHNVEILFRTLPGSIPPWRRPYGLRCVFIHGEAEIINHSPTNPPTWAAGFLLKLEAP